MPVKKGLGDNRVWLWDDGGESRAIGASPVVGSGNTGGNNGNGGNSGKGKADPTLPVKPVYETYGAAPVYNSPTAGRQYSYSAAAPTWQWDDSGRPGDWAFDQERPTYTNQYQDQINSMVDAILNREKFSYDYNQDPLYRQYAEAYTRNGRQAMNDTLAQMAARTGGLASSYANTASQQTYNNYMQALNDKIPELRQIAYNMYMDEGNTMRNNLGMIQGLESTDYGRYQDALGQWNTDRNFSYGQYQDDWDRYYNDRDFSYGQYRDNYDDWYNERNWDYGLWQDNLSRQEAAAKAAYQNQLAAWNANKAGVDARNAARDAEYQKALDAYNNSIANRSSSSGATGSAAYQALRGTTPSTYKPQVSTPYSLPAGTSSPATTTVKDTGVGSVITFNGRNWDVSNPSTLRELIQMVNTMPLSESAKKNVMDDINKYLK